MVGINEYKRFKLISLQPSGGFTLGFTKAFNHNFELVWANDLNHDLVKTYINNFQHPCYLGNIINIIKERKIEIPKCDVVIGKLPVPTFLGRRDSIPNTGYEYIQAFCEVVKLTNAKIFIFNVNLNFRFRENINFITHVFDQIKFTTHHCILNSVDLGVPLFKKQGFIIGHLTELVNNFDLEPTYYSSNKSNKIFSNEPKIWQTVRDAIADLPLPEEKRNYGNLPPLDLHYLDLLLEKRLSDLLISQYNQKFYQRKIVKLLWDSPSPFIHTYGLYLHPEQNRPLTLRELARLHTFPDSYHFCGSSSSIKSQIFTTVPPLLAANLANYVYKLLLLSHDIEQNNNTDNQAPLLNIQELFSPISLESQANELISQLGKIVPGREDWRLYEDICMEILNFLFYPVLLFHSKQTKSDDGLDRFDAIYSLDVDQYYDSYWNTVKDVTNTRFIVVEFKNLVDSPDQKAVEAIKDYLYKPAFRKFGILCSRKKADKSAIIARRRAWLNGELLIVMLCDDDLKNMIEMKVNNLNPAKIIKEQIDDFFATLTP